MKIGILGAMEQEMALLRASLEGGHQETQGPLEFYSGRLHGVEVVLVQTGIGKVAATLATALMIQCYKPDYVVNTGSAGGFDARLNIGDLIIASAVQHHDVDVTHFGFEHGQVFGLPKLFPCDQRLIHAAQHAAETITDIHSQTGLIGTGDSFIGCDEAVGRVRGRFPELCAVEMEGAAIGQACYQLQTPFVVIRALSDIAGVDSLMSFESYLDKASHHSATLVMAMIKRLSMP
ncbi:Adenosylhomocysteine nucleosidase [Saliniradius amylolyticus]|uniref:5'-methylthioadenosine/S-adenosylhomocysteine nucleosidase n=1 Tax=Saliniradius amylolyticus TaxID=2183582 RepID=A0A2S2E5P8_9ALTE|nr:5'-methylthioadenosine/adenosylhomocysteine nucleosidase [Saliniradius amylolyticus]AWL12981.1 Adenosylhomocysteine nucleosidase [Saliniradius amylolyticus]